MLLAIDWGSFRLGLAHSLPGLIGAQPLTIINVEGKLRASGMESLVSTIADHNPEAIVMGLPLIMSLEDEKCQRVRDFAHQLHHQYHIPHPIYFCNEAFTSEQSRDVLNLYKMRPAKQEQHIDSMAAARILSRFLGELERVRKLPPSPVTLSAMASPPPPDTFVLLPPTPTSANTQIKAKTKAKINAQGSSAVRPHEF
eukprot:TRINITY_DN4609_c0_g1_i2.p1 TRINITY_DN4609_c0_g1~~TRINITY_DN4609_c0_g1_i2.p1  ORF type:complete len:198 (+),score=43.98 TRINITY_DN4609_c0_g1_i2:172-765(+)